jgi:hypothetical protein
MNKQEQKQVNTMRQEIQVSIRNNLSKTVNIQEDIASVDAEINKMFVKWQAEIQKDINSHIAQYCSLQEMHPNNIEGRIRLEIDQISNSKTYYDQEKIILKADYDFKNLFVNIDPVYANDLTVYLRGGAINNV